MSVPLARRSEIEVGRRAQSTMWRRPDSRDWEMNAWRCPGLRSRIGRYASGPRRCSDLAIERHRRATPGAMAAAESAIVAGGALNRSPFAMLDVSTDSRRCQAARAAVPDCAARGRRGGVCMVLADASSRTDKGRGHCARWPSWPIRVSRPAIRASRAQRTCRWNVTRVVTIGGEDLLNAATRVYTNQRHPWRCRACSSAFLPRRGHGIVALSRPKGCRARPISRPIVVRCWTAGDHRIRGLLRPTASSIPSVPSCQAWSCCWSPPVGTAVRVPAAARHLQHAAQRGPRRSERVPDGVGKEIKGEGLVGRHALHARLEAPRVVASLWQVSDLATAELMSGLCRDAHAPAWSPVAGLRAAQSKLTQRTVVGAAVLLGRVCSSGRLQITPMAEPLAVRTCPGVGAWMNFGRNNSRPSAADHRWHTACRFPRSVI